MDNKFVSLVASAEYERARYIDSMNRYGEVKMRNWQEDMITCEGKMKEALRDYALATQKLFDHYQTSKSNDDTQELVYENGTLRPLREGEESIV